MRRVNKGTAAKRLGTKDHVKTAGSRTIADRDPEGKIAVSDGGQKKQAKIQAVCVRFFFHRVPLSAAHSQAAAAF